MRYTERMNWKPVTHSDKSSDTLPFELTAVDQRAVALAREALQAHVARLNALDTYPRRKKDDERGN